MAFQPFVRPASVHVRLVKGIVAGVVLAVAALTVGLTASPDSPLSIAVQPVLLRLGVDLDVKIGSLHLHASWSALPDASTKPDGGSF